MKITDWNVRAFDVPMRSPYRSAQRITTTAHNVLLTVTVDGEHTGVGESAPAMYVTGETQATVLAAIEAFFTGHLPTAPFALLERAAAELAETPGALGAVEIAVLDAVARSVGVPLYRLLNPAAPFTDRRTLRVSDLSLPILPPEEAASRAAEAAAQGFRTFKIKVGAEDIREDMARVRAVAKAAPNATLRLDGNQAFTPETAFALLNNVPEFWGRVEMFEQPTPAGDDAAMVTMHDALPAALRVFADESCHNEYDAKRLIEGGICAGVVIKLAKSGLLGAARIAWAAHESGGVSMLGCMMETRIGIGAALHLAVALGETVVPMLDLDGHLLTDDAGLLTGGFTQIADVLEITPGTLGLGVSVVDV